MMISTSQFLLAVLFAAVSVHGQNSTNTTGSTGLSFRGPGYLACDIAEYRTMECNITVDLVNCTADQFVQECNVSALVGSTDLAFTTAYIPLVCDCVVAIGCPASCEQFSGDVPTLPPVAYTANFSGVGSVTCPLISLVEADVDACLPTVIDNSTCGTCDYEAAITFDDDSFGYMDGDANITIPLLCECVVLLGCPDTCSFVATDDGPTTPVAAPVSKPTAPAAAPVRSPTAPVRSPTAAAPSTSAAFATTIHTYKCVALLTFFALVSIVML